MITTEEVIKRSNEIAYFSEQIQSLKNEYANYAKKMEGTMKQIEELETKQKELAESLATQCSKTLTIDDLDE